MTNGRGRLYAGTSGFDYPTWVPRFYAPGRASRRLLEAYARKLPAVELHSTFYRRPAPQQIEKWLRETGPDFRFCPKAQRSTSWRAFAEPEPAASIRWLTDALAVFGDRLGCALLSLRASLARDDAALERALAAWPRNVPLALELLHPSWADEIVGACAERHGVTLVATDLDGRDEPQLHAGGGFAYLRLRRSAYEPKDLDRWAARLEPVLAGGTDAYVFFRHDEDGTMALRAEALLERLGDGAPAWPRPDGAGVRWVRPSRRPTDETDAPGAEEIPMNPPTETVTRALQSSLVELIDMALLGKQAHWSVVGPQFRSVHLELDEIVDLARVSYDRVAERLATLGVAPDGRAETIASSSELPPFPPGFVPATETVQRVTQAMDTIAMRAKERIVAIGDEDPVSQDILIGITDEIEKAAWMLRSQLTM